MVAMACAFADAVFTGMPDLNQPADEWGIGYDEAVRIESVIWVDGRTIDLYEKAHYPDALHLDFNNWDTGLFAILEKWEPGMGIVVYCEGSGCESSRAIAERLRNELEMDAVYWLTGGWNTLMDGVEAQ